MVGSHNNALKLLLADKNEVVREGVFSTLNKNGFHQSNIIMAEDLNLFVHQPDDIDFVITDYTLFQKHASDLRKYKKTKIIIFSSFDNAHVINESISEGASAFILKGKGLRYLSLAIHDLRNGKDTYLCPYATIAINETVPEFASPKSLTKRELEITKLLHKGLSNKAIATSLGITLNTTETHRKNIMKKTGTKNISDIVRYANMYNIV